MELNTSLIFIDYLKKLSGSYDSTFIEARENKKWTLHRRNGQAISPFVFDEIKGSYNNDNFIQVKRNGKWGLIDTNGNVIIPFSYEQISPSYFLTYILKTSTNKTVFAQIGKNNHINYCTLPEGLVLSEFMDYSLIKYKHNGKYGLFQFGKGIITKDEYDYIKNNFQIYRSKSPIHISVEKNKDKDIMNASEKETHFIYRFNFNYFVVGKNNKSGLIDSTGKEIIPCLYGHNLQPVTDIEMLNENLFKVICDCDIKKNLKYELFDINGNKLVY